jgi:hypothetical protein
MDPSGEGLFIESEFAAKAMCQTAATAAVVRALLKEPYGRRGVYA